MMDPIRDALGRLASSAGPSPELEDVARARTTRRRRRQAGGVAVGLVFTVGMGLAAVSISRSGDAAEVGPAGESGATPGAVSTMPYLWPENWASAEGVDAVADLVRRLKQGDADVAWRREPQEVVERFAHEVLHWDSVSFEGQQSATTTQWWEISPGCTGHGCGWQELVRIDRIPGSDAWAVTSVQAPGLTTEWQNGMDPVEVDRLAGVMSEPSEVSLHGFDGHRGNIDIVTYDGCTVERATRANLSTGSYSVDPPRRTASPGCRPTPVGYLVVFVAASATNALPLDGDVEFSEPGVTIVPISTA